MRVRTSIQIRVSLSEVRSLELCGFSIGGGYLGIAVSV